MADMKSMIERGVLANHDKSLFLNFCVDADLFRDVLIVSQDAKIVNFFQIKSDVFLPFLRFF